MRKPAENDSPLRLAWDRAECSVVIENLEIVAAPWPLQPFPCDAIVEEQDTFLLLGESRELPASEEKTWYLTHKMQEQQAVAPGSVIMKRHHKPLRLMAVVNDVAQEPVSREEWVWSALVNIFELATTQKFESLALPLLGMRYGQMKADRVMNLVQRILMSSRGSALRRLWLILPPGSSCRVLSVFRSSEGVKD
jgi:hypothetical protein